MVIQDTVKSFWSPLVTLILVVVAFVTMQNSVAEAKKDIKQIQDSYVTKQILELTRPLQQVIDQNKESLRENKESMKRIEGTNWQILQHLKAQDGSHSQ